MSCIHYKFRSSLEYDTITFDGLAISLGDLKKAIMAQKKIAKVTDFDLEVTNAQTKEEYKDESTQIPKNSSVVVRRIPTGTRSKAQLAADRADTYASGLPKTKNDSQELLSSVSTKPNKIVDLVNSDASEEDKLKAMMSQAGEDWQPNQYIRGRGRGYNPSGPLPPNYVCYRCGKPGHFIRNCPTNGVKRTIGIPRNFGEDTTTETTDDKDNKKDPDKKLVAVQEVKPSQDRKIPSELKCPMCKNLLSDAVLIPCCGTSYCDECIRTYLLENDQVCPTCGAEDVSPDSLIINKQLRQAVNNFRNARPASPFVNSTTNDKSTPSSTVDKTAASSTEEKPSQSDNTENKPSSTASPDVKSPDTSEKEKAEEKVTSTTSETNEKGDVSEVKKEESIKKEGSPLVIKGEVNSPRTDTASDAEDHHHSGPRHFPRDQHRQITRPGGHVGPMPGYGQHPMHRGPPGPGITHPIVEPIIPRSLPPDGALLVPSIRTARPILTQMHPTPVIPQAGFMAANPLGIRPVVRLPVEPTLLGAALPFGVKPPGFHPFNDQDGPPMSEQEFYRYQKRMKLRNKKKHRERERERDRGSREKTTTTTRSHPANFDDELSQYRALQRHRRNYRSRSRSTSRSKSRSFSRSLSRSPSHSSHSLSKSPTPEDWDRSRTPSPSSAQAVSESKSPEQNEKKLKRKKRKKHKHKHSKKRKSEHNAENESTKEQASETEKAEKKKSKSRKKSKEKTSKEKSLKKEKVESQKVEEKTKNENSIEPVEQGTDISQKVEKGKSSKENPVKTEDKDDHSDSKTNSVVNENKKSKNSEEGQEKSEKPKRKSKEKSSDKKHKKKKHKRKHKKHKKEKEKSQSQSADENNASTEETQEDSEEENGNEKDEIME